ncbi:MAG: hypothetical protein RMK97_03340 [Sutterellaceae bacterium]|nr:hypothetical protein [Burkholderiaceae bacterium]MDW8429525.1 hypothetical protein [Sutterellaceae bacterium]
MICDRRRNLTRLLLPAARAMGWVQKITSRRSPMRIIRGVSVLPAQTEELIRKQQLLAPH